MASQVTPKLALRPWSSVVFGALSLGPRLHRPWTAAEAWGLGGVLALDLIADRLRFEVEVGLTHFGGAAPADADGLPILLGVSLLDLPGLVWLGVQ